MQHPTGEKSDLMQELDTAILRIVDIHNNTVYLTMNRLQGGGGCFFGVERPVNHTQRDFPRGCVFWKKNEIAAVR
jgi:hypothetical protein